MENVRYNFFEFEYAERAYCAHSARRAKCCTRPMAQARLEVFSSHFFMTSEDVSSQEKTSQRHGHVFVLSREVDVF